MYHYIEQFSHAIGQPFLNLATSVESVPILFALLLGLVGALAPCQLSGNMSAITLYGTKSINRGISWIDTLFFVLGKIVAFSGIGLVIFLLGQEMQQQLPLLFEPMRKLIGPVLIIIGIYMLGLFHFRWTITLWKRDDNKKRKGKWGAFMLGLSFSLAFCPTMAMLFFMLLMPLTISTSYGVVLPSLFAVGTSIPFLIVIFIIWYLGLSGQVMRKGRKIGLIVQRIAGGFMIFLGVLDIMTFW
ncbi:sulfite exporter TauE/SafE family protein [Evansella cellulosilytica]|uniref:Cytochrome c biogenesis protein transmembrane region n=1 Tax=Evansella cellulosilytica (strain ATCC 21833 / DSM 2522 / FERM P-1141 / JCM 9156 / N-4) TaxID=649639 RepID=E6TUE0_EVAC2|nr:sulfite exporter TauE/SafE family protein [Evansella cellulosilytica]ADU29696.1 cytochrome c biogenesis protein transmembrane region [Evansella cellulosilytica DSM 2522]